MPAESEVTRGDVISVYWPRDKTWYDGRVESFDAVSGTCEVLYDDGERQMLNLLKQTKYKYKVQPGGKVIELIDRVRANDGEVSKQLKDIGDVLRNMSDRLPSAGCWSSREGWWSDWYSGIESAVEAGNVIALATLTFDLACQLKCDVVTTPWWKAEGKNWRGRLRYVKTCEDLVSCVEDLRIKAVDWKKARRLFSNSRNSSESD